MLHFSPYAARGHFLFMDELGKKIAIITDAWFPHVSGVAVTLRETKKQLENMGHEVLIIGPSHFKFTIPLPGYPEIKLAFFAGRSLRKMLDDFNPDAIHISVEGPLGFSARSYCVRKRLRFSSAYHTRFPEYVHVRVGIPISWSYAFLRWFHGRAVCTMVPSEALKKELESHGMKNLVLWSRGVDTVLFNPDNPASLAGERPLFMYMGRIAVEKNLEAFLKLDLPGTMYVVGDGPARKMLQAKYPDAIFTGYKFGEELSSHLAAADVFVFPSKTDTLGLVMLEANACGLPIASFYSQASLSVVEEGVNGALSDDLQEACLRALTLSKQSARAHALKKGWEEPTRLFLRNLVSVRE